MAPSAKKVLNHPTYGRILKVLDGAPRGCDVNVLLSHGFKFATISDLVRAGLAVARLESAKARDRTVEIARIRITDAGRNRLEFGSIVGAPPGSEATLAVASAVVKADAPTPGGSPSSEAAPEAMTVAELETSMAEATPDPKAGLATSRATEADASMAKMMRYSEAMLAMARRHVAEGEERITRITVAMARRRELGLSIGFAEDLLDTMLVTLSLMIDRKAEIEARLTARNASKNFRGS